LTGVVNPRFQGENFYKNLELVNKVKEIADEKGVKPGQIALAWVLARIRVLSRFRERTRRYLKREHCSLRH